MKYRPEIDGLRALAVVPVVFYHAGFSAFSGGFVGVDVFFVISGYLITTIIADEISQDRFSLVRFYERRARRILPVLITVILTTLPFAWFWMMPRDLETYTYSILAVLTFTSNFFFFSETGYFETNAALQPLLHTWSLAVEEQFYIFFPLLMMLLGRRSPWFVFSGLALVSLIFAEGMLRVNPAHAFFLLPTRAWELLIGSMAAIWLRQGGALPSLSLWMRDLLSVLGLVLIVYGIVVYDDATRFPGLSAVPPTLGTVLLILFAQPKGLVQRVLAFQPLVWIGLISYGTYLWHQPVFALYHHRFGSVAFDSHVLLLIALSFALAFASYHLVEQPFRKTLGLRAVVRSLLASGAVAAGLAVALFLRVDGHPESVPSYAWAIENADADLIRYVEREDVFLPCKDGGYADVDGVQTCDFGDENAPRDLVLWGDSLALALHSGMQRVAGENKRGGIAFLANGCPPVFGLSNTQMASCDGRTHDAVLTAIEALADVKDVVITGNLQAAMTARNVEIEGRAASSDAVHRGLSEAVERLRAKGIRVVLLEQGPVFDEDVSDYLLQNLRRGAVEPLTLSVGDYGDFVAPLRRLTDLPDDYIDVEEVFCDDATCSSVDDTGALMIYNRNHVTRIGSEKVARHLFEKAGL